FSPQPHPRTAATLHGEKPSKREGRPRPPLQLYFSLGILDRHVLALGGDDIYRRLAVLDRLDRAADDDLGLRRTHATKLDREAFHRARIAANRFGAGTGDEAHHVEAVQDRIGQPDRFRELGVDVDRVEVA